MPKTVPLFLFGGPPSAISRGAASRIIVTLPWSQGPFPRDPWLAQLLPLADHNETLLARLESAPPPPGAMVALFLADPLLEVDETLARLDALAVDGVAGFPSLTRFSGSFADALVQAGTDPQLERRRLAAAGQAGFRTLAGLWTAPRGPAPAPAPDYTLSPAGAAAPGWPGTALVYDPKLGHRPGRELLRLAARPHSR